MAKSFEVCLIIFRSLMKMTRRCFETIREAGESSTRVIFKNGEPGIISSYAESCDGHYAAFDSI